MLKKFYGQSKDIIILGIVSILIGIIVGIIDTIFGKILIYITEFRDENALRLLPFLCFAGVIIIYVYNKFGKNSIKGMTLVFESAEDKDSIIPKRLIPLIMGCTWLTHLFGGSAGREGVAVQIGATVGNNIGDIIKIDDSRRILLVTGMAAGFGGLFQTPIAAVFFALEVLAAVKMKYVVGFTSFLAAVTASCTSHFLGLEKFSFNLSNIVGINMSIELLFKIAVAGIVFGVTGGLFAHFLCKTKKYLGEILKNPLLKIFILGIILSILFIVLHEGRYSGLGTNLISKSFNGGEIYKYDWILKFILTIMTLSAGFQGGEVTPLFSIGASLGVIVGSIIGIPVELCAALGYISVFGGATNTFIAPVFIGAEVFGFEFIPFFLTACATAYIFNGNKTIYSSQIIVNPLKLFHKCELY